MKKPWKWYVYIIECKDGLYYTGMTWNTEIRFEQHRLGNGSKFTAKHGFKTVRYIEEFADIEEARQGEHQLKDFSRKKKESLWISSSQAKPSNNIAVNTIQVSNDILPNGADYVSNIVRTERK